MLNKINQAFLPTLSFHSLKFLYSKSVADCYVSQSIKQRLCSFSQLSLDIMPDIKMADLEIKMPQYLQLTTAKNVHHFHKNNKSSPNLIILHALAHIQFNAFMAYADTSLRFGCTEFWQQIWDGVDKEKIIQFREQMRRIAIDEGNHCLLLVERLNDFGVKFGDFPVIANLTQTVLSTNQDILERLALISIVHEGKGIKSIGRLIKTLQNCQDAKSIEVLRLIQSEETFHFECGLKWFKHLSQLESSKKGEAYLQFIQKKTKEVNEKYRCQITLQDLKMG